MTPPTPSPTAPIARVMGLIAASLAVMSILHLSGVSSGGSAPFDPNAAGIAEAIIGLVLAAGALALLRSGPTGSPAAVAATGFAIVGFVVGLSITIRGGGAVDIAYHATVLPLLLLTLVALLRTRPRRRGARSAV